MRRWRWVAVAVAALALVVMGLRRGCAPRPVAVGVATVATGDVERLVANSEAGTVRARRTARLAADRAGRVLSFPWREGDEIPVGHLVLAVDSSTAHTQLHASQHDAAALDAAHRAAHADAALAEHEYARVAALHERRVTSDEELDAAKARRQAAAAQLEAAEARMRAAESAVATRADELRHLRVRMPFAGVLTRRLVEEGESVVPGQAVAEVMTLDSLYVLAPLDERDAAQVRPGLPTRVTLDPFPGEVWRAPVTRVAPVVEETREQNRTLAIEVDLPPAASGPQPRPGMSADVEVVLDRATGVLRVPSAAVLEGRRVFVVRDDRAVSRDVTLGARNWDWSEVVSGLAAGDVVITTLDRAGLLTGVRVRVEAPADSVR